MFIEVETAMSKAPQMRMRFVSKTVLMVVAATLSTITISTSATAADSGFKLTFDRPANKWVEAFPVGNGRIGAMVFGGTEEERVQINESTLWGGVPHDYTNPEAYSHLDGVRKLIFAGKVDEAEKLAESMMGKPKLLMPYQPFCDMHLNFPGHAQITDYHRELRLDDAIVDTTYKVGDTTFRREVFASYPDQVLVVRISATQPGRLTFSIGLDSPQTGTQVQSTGSDTLQLTGQIQPRQNPPFSWTGSWDQPGIKFAGVLKVLTQSGSVRASGERLEITGADAVTILFSNATSFKNYRDISGDALGTAQAYLQKAAQRSYETILKRHLDDFRPIFSRVQLHLGEDHSTESIDQRIKNFAQNEDPTLLALYFEFGRYLLISCSRPGGKPANLQGIWNEDLLPAWSCKMTTNINLEMNYWQADAGDLWEMEEPLWSLIRTMLTQS